MKVQRYHWQRKPFASSSFQKNTGDEVVWVAAAADEVAVVLGSGLVCLAFRGGDGGGSVVDLVIFFVFFGFGMLISSRWMSDYCGEG